MKGKLNDRTCEDGIIVTNDYIAVVDGSTAKGTLTLGHKSSGRVAMETICESLKNLKQDCTKEETARYLSNAIQNLYIQYNLWNDAVRDGKNRFTASSAIYSKYRNEIWLFGDCQCRVKNTTYHNIKVVDQILKTIRCDIIHYLLKKGHSISSLRHKDLGRLYIGDALTDQCSFQNATSAGPFKYTVIDGFPIDCSNVPTISCTEISEAILATDGYPLLFNTLNECEAYLHTELKKDPLCCFSLHTTKGTPFHANSYDDRALIRFML